MPFDLNNPKPPEIYDTPHGRRRRYWPYPNSIENLPYTPISIRSWRSVTTLPPNVASKCKGECIEKPMHRYYPENYLHEQVMLENPTILAALKNTPIIRNTPATPLELVPPRFVHKSKKSRFHIVVPQIYREALCKITDNLNNEPGVQKKTIKNKDHKERDVTTKKTLRNASKTDSSNGSNGQGGSKSSLTYVAKSEGFLKHVRRKIEQDIETQEQQNHDKRFFSSELEFDKNKTPHFEGYNWDKRGGMEAMCVTYPGISIFHESPSEIPPALKVSEEISENSNLLKNNKDVISKIPADMMKLFLNAPNNNLMRHAVNPDQFKPFSHYGLLETAKADALETCLKKLYRREREVKLPNAVMNNVYGPLKGMPEGYKFQAPHIPEHLGTDCPPESEEIEKVERVMKNEKQARRSRKARGVQSVEPVSRVLGKFSKPMIESSENEDLIVHIKSAMSLDDYPTKYNELNKRDSSDSLFCQVGAVKLEQENNGELQSTKIGRRKNTWLVDIMAKSSTALAMHKALWQDQLESGSTTFRVLPTISDMSSSSPENSSEEIRENGHHEVKLMETKDSRDTLPYPDFAFSAIRVPSDAKGITDNWLYRKLAEDQRSLSSSDSNDHPENDEFTDEDEKEEEEEEYPVKEETSDASVALDEIFKNIQPLLRRSSRLKVTASKYRSSIVE